MAARLGSAKSTDHQTSDDVHNIPQGGMSRTSSNRLMEAEHLRWCLCHRFAFGRDADSPQIQFEFERIRSEFEIERIRFQLGHNESLYNFPPNSNSCEFLRI